MKHCMRFTFFFRQNVLLLISIIYLVMSSCSNDLSNKQVELTDEFCKNVTCDLKNRCVNYCYKVRLEQTVKYAKENTSNGDVVAMSPASASFDLYKNFMVRGEYFKQLVNEL